MNPGYVYENRKNIIKSIKIFRFLLVFFEIDILLNWIKTFNRQHVFSFELQKDDVKKQCIEGRLLLCIYRIIPEGGNKAFKIRIP